MPRSTDRLLIYDDINGPKLSPEAVKKFQDWWANNKPKGIERMRKTPLEQKKLLHDALQLLAAWRPGLGIPLTVRYGMKRDEILRRAKDLGLCGAKPKTETKD